MIKTQTCVLIECDGCARRIEHDYEPHFNDAGDAREEWENYEGISLSDGTDWCETCRVAGPHGFVVDPKDPDDDCLRCNIPLDEHDLAPTALDGAA